jgi:hypothetical protein
MLRGVPYIKTKNIQDTASTLVDMTRDIIRLYKDKELTFPLQEARDHNKYINLLDIVNSEYSLFLVNHIRAMTTPWIKSPSPSHDILSRRVPQTISEIEISMWRCFPGVGDKLSILLGSIRVRDALNMDRELLATQLRDLRYESGSKIPNKTINSILSGLDDMSIHAKILATVQGVTLQLANEILKQISLADLFEGKFSLDELCLIKLVNNSGLARGAATKIKKLINILCPDYLEPLKLNSPIYLSLAVFGNPEILRRHLSDIKTTTYSKTIVCEFNADEEYDYPKGIEPGINRHTIDM